MKKLQETVDLLEKTINKLKSLSKKEQDRICKYCKYCKYFNADMDYLNLGTCKNKNVSQLLTTRNASVFVINDKFGCKFWEEDK